MVELKQKEMKQYLLNILKFFDEFAIGNDICYSLAYGTLIGAIRHKGFIPWDDDIDIVVPRPDYNRIIEFACRGRRFGPYAFVGYGVDSFPMPFIKLIDTRVVVKDRTINRSIVQHLWVDIFPLDGCFADKLKYARVARASARNTLTIAIGNFDTLGSSSTRVGALLKKILTPTIRILRINKRAMRRLTQLARKGPSYEDAEYVANIIWGPYGEHERFEKRLFSATVPLEFEGYTFSGMIGWDEYLTGIYGDYMQIPPYEERCNHGIVAYIEGLPNEQ